MRNLSIILLISLTSFANAKSTDHPETLQKLFKMALENSPSLQISKANILDVQGQKEQTSSYQDWDVRFKSELSYSAMKNSQFPRTANQLIGRYPLYQPDIDYLVQADEFELKAMNFSFETERQQLFYDIAINYFQYYAQHAEILFLEQERISIQNILEQFNQRLQIGEQNISRVAEMQAELDVNQAELLAQLEKKWSLQIKIEKLVGKKVFIKPIIKIENVLKINPSNIILEKQVEQHPKLLKLKMEEHSASQKIAYQKHKEGVRLDAFVSAVYNDSDSNFYDDMQGVRAGLTLEIPLYIGDRTDANIMQFRAKKQAKQAKYQQQKLILLSSARTSHLLYNASLARIVAIKASIQSYQQVIKAIERSISSGKQDSIDLLKAERLLNKAKKELNLTKIKVWKNGYQFYWSIGKL